MSKIITICNDKVLHKKVHFEILIHQKVIFKCVLSTHSFWTIDFSLFIYISWNHPTGSVLTVLPGVVKLCGTTGWVELCDKDISGFHIRL